MLKEKREKEKLSCIQQRAICFEMKRKTQIKIGMKYVMNPEPIVMINERKKEEEASECEQKKLYEDRSLR